MASKRTGAKPAFPINLAALAVASAFAGSTYANPTLPTVIAGSASFATSGNALNITNSPGAIIQWQNFSIGAGELTRFLQQNAASAVLNRVIGSEASSILGQLLSNGRVFLLNPNGIFIGGGAVIDTAGFVASSLRLSDTDFLAGKFKFDEQIGAGRVVNQGEIRANGGPVYLIAPNVENHGVITNPSGEVILAAGKSVELVTAANPNLRVELNAPENEAINVGKIVADAGSVGIYGTTVRNTGTVSANSASVDAQGRIVFRAKKDVTLDAGSRLEVNGPKGGTVVVQAEGGTLLDSGAIEAKGAQGTGGTVQLLGDRVGLIDQASVNASGETGGGTVLVGGDFQGRNAEVQNAGRTYVAGDVSIKADALKAGDGGKVVVWANDWTRYFGSISATGGVQQGNGGVAEVSGKQDLTFNGAVDLTAPNGRTGSLLLDPSTLQITAGAAVANDLSGSVPTILAGTADGTSSNGIAQNTLQAIAGTADITLEATGQITVQSLSGGLLNLQTGHNNTFRMTSTTSGGITFQSNTDEIRTAGGNITLQAQGSGALSNLGKLTSNGGAITLETAATGSAVGAINSLGGAISITPTAGTFSLSGGIGGTGSAVTVSGAGNTTLAGGVNTSTGGTLSKSGSGTLTVSAAGDFTGGTSLTAGTLIVSDNNALGTGTLT